MGKRKQPNQIGRQNNSKIPKFKVVNFPDSEAKGPECSSTEVWLNIRHLDKFVEIFKANKMDINVLLECSRDELFKIFKGIGLKTYENVKLRFAITRDKNWKGGLDVLFALGEKTYTEVQKISMKLSE